MTIEELVLLGRRWWWVVALGAALAGIASFAVSSVLPKTYEASTTLVITGIDSSSNLPQTYSEIATSRTHLQRVADVLGGGVTVDELEDDVRARVVPSTSVIEITAENGNAVEAARIANTLATGFPQYLGDANLGDARALSIVSAAATPGSPTSPKTNINVFLGVVLGLVLVVGAIALVEYLDDTIDSRDSVRRAGLPFLGEVVEGQVPDGVAPAGWLPRLAEAAPSDPLVESYRNLQASVAFARGATGAKVILVSSAIPGEGRTATVANLALALSGASVRVLAVDADLASPGLHRYFSLANTRGLGTLIADGAQPTAIASAGERLAVLPAGPAVPEVGDALGAAPLHEALRELAGRYDVVLIDGPAVLSGGSLARLAPAADGVVLVAWYARTRREQLVAAAATVEAARIPLLGVVLNGVPRRRSRNVPRKLGVSYGAPNADQ